MRHGETKTMWDGLSVGEPAQPRSLERLVGLRRKIRELTAAEKSAARVLDHLYRSEFTHLYDTASELHEDITRALEAAREAQPNTEISGRGESVESSTKGNQ